MLSFITHNLHSFVSTSLPDHMTSASVGDVFMPMRVPGIHSGYDLFDLFAPHLIPRIPHEALVRLTAGDPAFRALVEKALQKHVTALTWGDGASRDKSLLYGHINLRELIVPDDEDGSPQAWRNWTYDVLPIGELMLRKAATLRSLTLPGAYLALSFKEARSPSLSRDSPRFAVPRMEGLRSLELVVRGAEVRRAHVSPQAYDALVPTSDKFSAFLASRAPGLERIAGVPLVMRLRDLLCGATWQRLREVDIVLVAAPVPDGDSRTLDLPRSAAEQLPALESLSLTLPAWRRGPFIVALDTLYLVPPRLRRLSISVAEQYSAKFKTTGGDLTGLHSAHLEEFEFNAPDGMDPHMWHNLPRAPRLVSLRMDFPGEEPSAWDTDRGTVTLWNKLAAAYPGLRHLRLGELAFRPSAAELKVHREEKAASPTLADILQPHPGILCVETGSHGAPLLLQMYTKETIPNENAGGGGDEDEGEDEDESEWRAVSSAPLDTVRLERLVPGLQVLSAETGVTGDLSHTQLRVLRLGQWLATDAVSEHQETVLTLGSLPRLHTVLLPAAEATLAREAVIPRHVTPALRWVFLVTTESDEPIREADPATQEAWNAGRMSGSKSYTPVRVFTCGESAAERLFSGIRKAITAPQASHSLSLRDIVQAQLPRRHRGAAADGVVGLDDSDGEDATAAADAKDGTWVYLRSEGDRRPASHFAVPRAAFLRETDVVAAMVSGEAYRSFSITFDASVPPSVLEALAAHATSGPSSPRSPGAAAKGGTFSESRLAGGSSEPPLLRLLILYHVAHKLNMRRLSDEVISRVVALAVRSTAEQVRQQLQQKLS